jgi:hypothetical protein
MARERNNRIFRALLLQGLFFLSWFGFGQEVLIRSPRPGEPLDEQQEVVVSVLGAATPIRVELYLNGRLAASREAPPFRFDVRWNTSLENVLRAVAVFENDVAAESELRFSPIRVDVETEVLGFHVFPFLEGPLPAQPPEFSSDAGPFEPQQLVPAEKYQLDLVIALDVSGSMAFSLGEITEGAQAFIRVMEAAGAKVRFVVFDRQPRLAATADVLALESLETLYKTEGKSIIWDTLATASVMFRDSPRRTIILISDGYDDGSKHDDDSVAQLLREANASLIWLNPTRLQNRQLARLAGKSGGFGFYNLSLDTWRLTLLRFSNQLFLLAPDVRFPIDIDLDGVDAWYPRWDD